MSCSVKELAALVNARIVGDGERVITDCAAVERAKADELTFIADRKNADRLADSNAGAACVPAESAEALHKQMPDVSLLVVDHPQAAFQQILRHFRPQKVRPTLGISPTAIVHETARIGAGTNIFPGAVIGERVVIGENCDIHPGVVIGEDCVIGDDCILHPHVVLYADVVLGSRVELHAGAVIGARGFGYTFSDGRFEPIPQLGHVEIGDDVEVGAMAAIDRGAIGPTLIGEGTKIDNMVQIAHNCEIGRHNVIASQVGLAGSVQTGDFVRLAGQVGVCDHGKLGTGCAVGAKSGVLKEVPAGESWVGYPALPAQEQKRIVFLNKRLPDLRDRIKQLEKEVAELRGMSPGSAAREAA